MEDSKARQEGAWLHNGNAELAHAGEVATIEGDDYLAPGGYRELEEQIVLGIREEGSPEIEDRLEVSDGTEVVQEGIDVGVVQPGYIRVTEQGILILKHEWDGKSDLESTLAYLRQKTKGGPASGAQPCDQNVRIQNDPWRLSHGIAHDTTAGRSRLSPSACRTPRSAAKLHRLRRLRPLHLVVLRPAPHGLLDLYLQPTLALDHESACEQAASSANGLPVPNRATVFAGEVRLGAILKNAHITKLAHPTSHGGCGGHDSENRNPGRKGWATEVVPLESHQSGQPGR